MSAEKNKARGYLWFATAKTDLDAAIVLSDRNMFALACFHAQQAGEKAIKALSYSLGEDPWGHSIKKLIGDITKKNNEISLILEKIARNAMVLDRYYIGTRYPDGLPDLTPDEAYGNEDAVEAMRYASEIIAVVQKLIA